MGDVVEVYSLPQYYCRCGTPLEHKTRVDFRNRPPLDVWCFTCKRTYRITSPYRRLDAVEMYDFELEAEQTGG